MKEKFQKIWGWTLTYLKSLNWIVLLGIEAFCIALAVINNIRLGDPRASDAKSVEWIGTQDVLEKPAEVL